MTAWETLGLPPPESSGYGYSVNAGLLTTSFPTARPRRARKYLHSQRTFSLSFLLTKAELDLALNYLHSDGASWFQMRLLTGAESGDLFYERSIRSVAPVAITSVGYDSYRISLVAEEFVPLEYAVITPTEYSVYATSRPYSIVVSEYFAQSQPCAVDGRIFLSVFYEYFQAITPCLITGLIKAPPSITEIESFDALQPCLLTGRIKVPPQQTEIEAFDALPPCPLTGHIGATYFPLYYTAPVELFEAQHPCEITGAITT